jgi:hypothetical protein
MVTCIPKSHQNNRHISDFTPREAHQHSYLVKEQTNPEPSKSIVITQPDLQGVSIKRPSSVAEILILHHHLRRGGACTLSQARQGPLFTKVLGNPSVLVLHK